jgi:hypothetical protein
METLHKDGKDGDHYKIGVTPHFMEIVIKSLNLQLNHKVRSKQVVEVCNQKLKLGFKFKVFKFWLVWTDRLSQQFFIIHLTQIRPHSQKRKCPP